MSLIGFFLFASEMSGCYIRTKYPPYSTKSCFHSARPALTADQEMYHVAKDRFSPGRFSFHLAFISVKNA